MFARLKQLGLAALLVLLPLQGYAGAVGPLLCLVNAEARDVHSHSHAHYPAPGANQSHDQDNGGAGEPAIHHLCCQLSAPVIPSVGKVPAVADLPLFLPSFSLLDTLHIPERPRRPPRA